MKKFLFVFFALVIVFCTLQTVFAAELFDGSITENKDEEINEPDLKGLDYALSEIFTDGRGLVSDEVFQQTVYKLGLYKAGGTRPNGKTLLRFDMTGYVGIYVRLNEGETPDNVTAEELIERIGLNSKYVSCRIRGLAEGNENECIITIGLNVEAKKKFDTDNMSNLDELYLLATLYNATGSKFTYTRLLRGVAYSDTEMYHYDINLDGEFTLLDLKALKKNMLGNDAPINLYAADFNGDGEIGIKDSKLLKKAILEY